MKKFYSLMLVVVSLFSCVIFSACGDKYKNLNISFYSVGGENISAIEFLLNYEDDPTTIGIQFDGIKQKDLGQIQVFSEPFELTEVSNYRYNGNTVFVDVRANMSSTNAKLTAVHMASGKKQSIPLIINQKSTSLSVDKSLTYIVSIPEVDAVSHYVNMRELISLTPAGATDQLFFKTEMVAPVGVEFIKLKDDEQYQELGTEYDDVYTGFNVQSGVEHDSEIVVYPVTYLKDYENNNVDEFKLDTTKQIKIKFIKTLSKEKVSLTNIADGDEYEIVTSKENTLKLVTNDTVLKSINIVPKIKKVDGVNVSYEELSIEDYLKYYDILAVSENSEIASVHVDKALNNVIITSHLANQAQNVTITLEPKNAVGDIEPINLQIRVEGVLKADTIQVSKNLQEISVSTPIDILDYYNNNVPGTLFNFVSSTQAGAPVNEKLDDLQIIIDQAMLSQVNGGDGETYMHGLEFYLMGKPMQFKEINYGQGVAGVTYVATSINRYSNVYIKYVRTTGSNASALKIDVQTINEFSATDSTTKHLDSNATTIEQIVFNLVTGVKNASIQAGTFTANDSKYSHFKEGQINPKYIYLNKGEITSGADKAYYMHVVNDSLTDRMDSKIIGKLNFRAELVSVSKNISNPLKIANGFKVQESGGNKFVAYENETTALKFEHINNEDYDVIGFVIDANTQVGEYELYIYQENNKIAQTTIFVYDTLTDLTAEDIELSQNGKAFADNDFIFRNKVGENYVYEGYQCDYIAAVDQVLDFSVSLSQNIKNSNFVIDGNIEKQNIVAGYTFDIGESEYANILSTNKEKMKLEFVKGSMTTEGAKYVTLTISVELNTFSNILTPAGNESKTFIISFFIYEKVETADAKLSSSEFFKQPNDMVGHYFVDNSRDSVSIIMDENKWSYVSNLTWKVENNSNVGEDGVAGFKDADDDHIYNFYCRHSSMDYYSTIKVSFTQFARTFEYICMVHVNNPVLTERIVVNSEVDITDDEHRTAYINIKDGDTYNLNATQTASSGAEVTNKGLLLVIVDENGSQQYTSNYFTISEINSTITVKNVDNSHKFKLYILPKDLIEKDINVDKTTLSLAISSNRVNKLFIESIKDNDKYQNAYFMADIILSNGTKENPYLIRTAQEFFEIDDSAILLAAHYQLQTSFGLGSYKQQMPISGFSGSITTYGNNIYNIDGIILDASNKNLFTNFSGEMFGIRFGVKYDYKISINGGDEPIYLGLFDKLTETASLTNVFVAISDSGGVFNYQLSGDSTKVHVYFGALAGENTGMITYVSELKDALDPNKIIKTYQNIIGVHGSIQLEDGASGSTGVAFGGLVGKNTGAIVGSLDSDDDKDDIVFATTSGATHSISNIVINASLKNSNSTIGGVVGLNTTKVENSTNSNDNGTIQNAYVQSKITATLTDNVGGVIGTNKSVKVALGTDNDEVDVPRDMTNKLYNIKSVSTVNGKYNVGGITGKDNGGYYVDCDFQVLDNIVHSTAIRGDSQVGGLVGYSDAGKFVFCSVMSYVWDYKNLATQEFATPDIQGNNFVGGLVGQAISVAQYHVGTDSNSARLVVAHSSVNAYVQSKITATLTDNVGGIMTATSTSGTSVIHSSYFVGKLEGVYLERDETKDDLKHESVLVDNDGHVKYILSYAVYVNGANSLRGEIADCEASTRLDYNSLSTYKQNHWWKNDELNGGYIYVTKDDTSASTYPNGSHKPIFDVAPTSIEVAPKDDNKELRLNYYDFSIDNKISEEKLLELTTKENQKGIKDLLSFEIKPAGIGTVVLKTTSSNSQVVDISVDGKLIINGVGTCILTFTSVLDNDVKASINVVVEYPMGEFYIGTSSLNFEKVLSSDPELIGKGVSKQYYMLTKGSYSDTLNGVPVKYSYRTLLNANLEVEIAYNKSAPEGFKVEKYIKSTGSFIEDTTGVATYKIQAGSPFVLSVFEQLTDKENEWFDVTVRPYYIDDTNKEYLDEDSKKYYRTTDYGGDIIDISTTFKVKTMAGVTGVTTSYNKSIVYLNDTVTINLVFNSDIPFIEELVNSSNELINSLNKWNGLTEILASHAGVTLRIEGSNWDEIKGKIKIRVINYYDDTAHSLALEFEFDKSIDFITDAEKEFKFVIEIENTDKVVTVEYTLLSQRINRMDIKNYYYEKEKVGEDIIQYKVLYDILKASEENAGLIIIDMVPENAYYDYLEISDITGDEEIVFIQLTGENGNAVNTTPDVSKDGKGIKLYRYDDGITEGRFFIKTQISNDYSSKKHILEVRAYMSDGTMLASQRKIIDVKMLPSVKIEYIKPNGQYHTNIAYSEDGLNPTIQLANGANATIRITTKNATQEFNPILRGDLVNKYTLEHIAGDLYELRRNSETLDTVGNTLSLTVEAYAYYDIGTYEMAECTMTFSITNFVIHSVSVNQSIDNNTTTEIYGYYDKPLKLEFYFGPTDISYYDITNPSQPLHGTIYRLSTLNTQIPTMRQIKTVLEGLNNSANDSENPYLKLKNNNSEDYSWNVGSGENPLELNGNTLIVKDGYNKENDNIINRYLSIDFNLVNVSITGDADWVIKDVDESTDVDNDGNVEPYYNISKLYLLNFREVTQWNKPEVVSTAKEFMAMTSGVNYILKNNIELENYQPLDVALDEFDGNGYTITIKSFAKFNDVDIYAGLFQKVYSTMTVKNVVVKYDSQGDGTGNYTLGHVNSGSNSIDYYDLCNNPNIAYVSARFGGIAALNHGVITNCKVLGRVALRASIVEQNTDNLSTYSSRFYVGGMVAENTLDENGDFGYITHSTSKLQIFALANIGGFAYKNSGKISSSSVEEQATIYAYNMNLSNTLVVEVAGFVVENTNEISMSYVELQAGEKSILSSKYGTISAKDTSSGFVYDNSGDILDAYVVLSAAGLNNNKFYGFVANNMGKIYRAYTYINGGQLPSKNDVMFADSNTQNIFNSIQFIIGASVAHEVKGIKTLNPLNYISNFEEYKNVGFTFGVNGAVWVEQYGSYPTLKSSTEKVENSQGLLPISPVYIEEEGVDKTEYNIDFTSYGSPSNPFIITDLDDWNLFFNPEKQLAMTGYYRIVRDIKFEELGYYPLTSKVTFSGNIEGNNMELSDIMLYSTETLQAIGLFKKLEGINDATIKNEVRNLKLTVASVWASNTNAVGVLAGIIENFDVYNISIQGDYNVVVVGKNAVGGMAGVVKGNSHINQIESNVSVNATRATTQNNYSIYMSKSNNFSNTNLGNVYYAGSIAGILDLYANKSFDINSERKVDVGYFNVNNISVKSNTFIGVGDTVGGAFGFVGEQVKLINSTVEISGSIMGAQYSAGLVGENRGIIQNATVVLQDGIFKNASNVVAGVVGLNLGGLVTGATAEYNAIIHVYDFTIGGIVGRNLYGTVTSSHFNGNILAYYTGGIIGADYDHTTMLTIKSGTGAFAADNKANVSNVIPEDYVKYKETLGYTTVEIAHLSNVSISKNTFDSMLENASTCYIFKNLKEDPKGDEVLSDYIERSRVLGIVVGITSENVEELILKTSDTTKWQMQEEGETYKFNTGVSDLNYETRREFVIVDNPEATADAVYEFTDFNIIYNEEYIIPQIMYLVGAEATSMNSWNGYSSCYILVGLPLTND